MNKIGSSSFVDKAIKDNNFNIKKKFGQNFLTDQNVLTNIVDVSLVDKDINVIEIGPGLGALTEHLCKKAKKVLCYEIDKDLIPILEQNLKAFDNYKVINQDILEVDINQDIIDYFDSSPIYLVANLPYYITTPIILGLLEKTTLIRRYVMMMQDEVANRICARSDIKDYNALSIAIQYRASAKKELNVSRNVFIPKPNVDSAVISLNLYNELPYKANNEEHFFKLIRASFAQRRKTLVNNLLLLGIDREVITMMFNELKININSRGESLTVKNFVDMSNYLTQK